MPSETLLQRKFFFPSHILYNNDKKSHVIYDAWTIWNAFYSYWKRTSLSDWSRYQKSSMFNWCEPFWDFDILLTLQAFFSPHSSKKKTSKRLLVWIWYNAIPSVFFSRAQASFQNYSRALKVKTEAIISFNQLRSVYCYLRLTVSWFLKNFAAWQRKPLQLLQPFSQLINSFKQLV